MKAEGLEYWSQKIKEVVPHEEHQYLFSKAGVKLENGGISAGPQKESFPGRIGSSRKLTETGSWVEIECPLSEIALYEKFPLAPHMH